MVVVTVVVVVVLVGSMASLWAMNRRWPEVGRWRDVRRDSESIRMGRGLYQDTRWMAWKRWGQGSGRGPDGSGR